MLAFIDESSNPDDVVRGNPYVYVLAACIVPGEEEVSHIEDIVTRIKQQYNIPENFEIKMKHIIEGSENWRSIEPRKRVDFLETLINELRNYSSTNGYPKFIVTAVICRKDPQTVAIVKRIGLDKAVKKIMNEVLEVGYTLLIRKIVSLASRISSTYRYRYIKCIVDGSTAPQEYNVRGIIDSVEKNIAGNQFKGGILVSFRDSKKEICIQLSDVIAYLTRRYILGEHIKRIKRDLVLDIGKLWLTIQNGLVSDMESVEIS